jgi:hypothetical protein
MNNVPVACFLLFLPFSCGFFWLVAHGIQKFVQGSLNTLGKKFISVAG